MQIQGLARTISQDDIEPNYTPGVTGRNGNHRLKNQTMLYINLKNALNSNCKVSFAIKIAGIENVTRSQCVYLPCTPAVEVVESSMERIGRIKPTVRINLWQ